MRYINMKYGNSATETVDEFKTQKEARLMLVEYRMSSSDCEYWISSRCTNDWRNRE